MGKSKLVVPVVASSTVHCRYIHLSTPGLFENVN